MSDDPSATVRKLLIEGQGVPARKVTPDARILHDLGVDGDDAAEIFEALQDRFGTDFTELNRQWRVFFSTEGASPRAILIGILAIIICSGAAGVLTAALHWPSVAAWGLAIAMFVGGGWLFSRWFGRELQPLTVAGLAEIVQAGRWPSDPADVR
ncbi:acyl carrier protein [Sphingobium sp. CR28]|uniref:acyl carrier protein n=1 Tax=Sphingobium sp. CR28 TaxID=3400272 RepID=UPI003FF13E6B